MASVYLTLRWSKVTIGTLGVKLTIYWAQASLHVGSVAVVSQGIDYSAIIFINQAQLERKQLESMTDVNLPTDMNVYGKC